MTASLRGIDSSGRAIYASDYLWDLWQRVLADLDFTPTIVQGAWMTLAGGGASESAGFHDRGGCFDLRTWDLTADQLETLVRTLRRYGIAAWRRDNEHGGFDPHLHFVCGTDGDLASGAAGQWADYLAGHDGLAGRGPDYEWRPSPLVTTPPEEDDMANYADQLARIEAAQKDTAAAVTALAKAEKKRADNQWRREAALSKALKDQGVDVDAILAAVVE